MKIAHVIRQPRLAGAEVLVRNLCKQHIQNGHEAQIIATHPYSEDTLNFGEGLGFQIKDPKEHQSRCGRLRHLRNAFNAFGADMIFAHTVLPSLFSRLASIGLNQTIASVLHSGSDDYSGSIGIAEYLAPRPDVIIGVTQKNIDRYVSRYGHVTATYAISNGVDLDSFSVARLRRSFIRSQFGIDSDRVKLFVHAGRLIPLKQQMLSVKAFELMPTSEQECSWLIFVGIAEDPNIEAMLNEALKRNPHIKYCGPQSNIPELFSAADAILVPSQYEAHPIVTIEGICSLSAVIGSDIEAHKFAQAYRGVTLVKTAQEMATAMASLKPEKFDRDLSAFDIKLTAAAYESIAHEFKRKL